MVVKKVIDNKVHYKVDPQGRFIIENYNNSKPFSNFFPGIAGLWGIPMWAFYVNRGQAIASFGIEAKNKAIMEFQPANKSYRLTSLQGFRTFIKVKAGKKEYYWEPFQSDLLGSDYKKIQKMYVSAHDLCLEEENIELGLSVKVTYFTLPEDNHAALVRKITVYNQKKSSVDIEIIDGLPMIVPYGLRDDINKNMSRTVEAWFKVRNLDKNAPYYQLNVEVDDKPEVTYIKEGHFFFSFDTMDRSHLLPSIVESKQVFGQHTDFIAPQAFLNAKKFHISHQETSNRTPCAMSYQKFTLKSAQNREIVSFFGYSPSIEDLNYFVTKAKSPDFVDQKEKLNKKIIDEIKDYAATNSSSTPFNRYAGHTFLDNILRGGLPISIKTGEGNIAFNVYSRKHGDLERDYNYFVVAPTNFSQGNGNYRDVNQNRRNDIWFNTDVRDTHLVNFLNLIQADGYNPLIVKGTTFVAQNEEKANVVLERCIAEKDRHKLHEYIKQPFLPGNLIEYIHQQKIKLNDKIYDVLGQILEICQTNEIADHGEGFWTDHWTYNLDLVESYLAVYPEHLSELLLKTKKFKFYHNNHFVLPRKERYILTERGVRQYESLGGITGQSNNTHLCTLNGEGGAYETHLTCKLLCLLANKISSLDPSGFGVEMEADKPNWYDSLNGLPGLLGSSISETIEIKRFAQFLVDSFNLLKLKDDDKISIFEELAQFISELNKLLASQQDSVVYWSKANDVKEFYRKQIRLGITGKEKELSFTDISNFLELVIKRVDLAVSGSMNEKGLMPTYFYHEVLTYDFISKEKIQTSNHVIPKTFSCHRLPLFLEGYVHALRASEDSKTARKLYEEVKHSDLFDKKLNMYKVNTDLSQESEEIGRTRIFPKSWLENESIWLHMEYKFILEILRSGLIEEFYENFKHVFVPFMKPQQYGRSILENSSFIVSSSHEDQDLHGQGFVARLSGSTAEFMHIWLYMNMGQKPFLLNSDHKLVLSLKPALAEWLFTTKKSVMNYYDKDKKNSKIDLPANSYAFKMLDSTLVVYHNPKRKNTFGKNSAVIKEITLNYYDQPKPIVLSGDQIPEPYSLDVRNQKVARIDIKFA